MPTYDKVGHLTVILCYLILEEKKGERLHNFTKQYALQGEILGFTKVI